MWRRNMWEGKGQSLAEFAILLPILLILALGAVDYGRVYFAYISVTNAARNGAQYGSTGLDAAADVDGIRDAALEETTELLNASPTNPTVSVQGPFPASPSCQDGDANPCVKVTVQYTFDTLFDWPGLPTAVTMERSVQMRVASE
jgi:Flp pilus assembly protein TadG